MQMDTVTYPDPSLAELLAQFTLVKVEHDAEKELVKQFGVGALPDVRLLAPDGRELDKLLGFTSAARLRTHLQAALDRLAGRAPEPSEKAEDSPAPVEATAAAIERATQRGVSELRLAWRQGLPPSSPMLAPEELVLYAWSAAGLRRGNADVDSLLERILAQPPAGTYRAALRALALDRLDPERLRSEIETCARWLESAQLGNGRWTYGSVKPGDANPGDASNSAYALLGLAACERSGVAVSSDVVERAQAAWRTAQNEDGGFGYGPDRETDSYLSMTASGLHCLELARDRFGIGTAEADDRAIARAGAWLRDQFSARTNTGSTYQEGRRLYALYALERVHALPPLARWLPQDWFEQGAGVLLALQAADGSFDDGAGMPVENTCLALLFLTRASADAR